MRLVGWLPTLIFAAMILLLVWSGAPAAYPNTSSVLQQVKSALADGEAVLLSTVLLVSVVIVQPLQFELVQAFEGYWASWPPIGWISALGKAWQHRGRSALEATWSPQKGQQQASAEEINRAGWRMRHRYPEEEQRLLPTALGNVLRAAEDRAGKRYGLDAVVVWPRLYRILPRDMTTALAEHGSQLDFNVRLTATLFLSIAVQIVVFIHQPAQLLAHPLWLLLPGGTLLVALISYRAAVSAAEGFGVMVEVAFDLYRFELFPALHLVPPTNYAEEVAANVELTSFLGSALHADPEEYSFIYWHRDRKRATTRSVSGKARAKDGSQSRR